MLRCPVFIKLLTVVLHRNQILSLFVLKSLLSWSTLHVLLQLWKWLIFILQNITDISTTTVLISLVMITDVRKFSCDHDWTKFLWINTGPQESGIPFEIKVYPTTRSFTHLSGCDPEFSLIDFQSDSNSKQNLWPVEET